MKGEKKKEQETSNRKKNCNLIKIIYVKVNIFFIYKILDVFLLRLETRHQFTFFLVNVLLEILTSVVRQENNRKFDDCQERVKLFLFR